MSAEPTPVNWVERRFRKGQVLAAQAADVWDAVRKQIQDACDTFKVRFLKEGGLEAKMENGHRISIVRTFQATADSRNQRFQVIVDYSSETFVINVARDGGSQEFRIDANESNAYITDGDGTLGPDEVSRRILEPLLFPTHPINPFARIPRIGEHREF